MNVYSSKSIEGNSRNNGEYETFHFAKLAKLDDIKKMDPVAFERFVGTLFERMGYEVTTTRESGDEGIDLFIERDGNTSIVQCKRFQNQVGQPVVRDLYGVMLHTHAYEAYLVTTGTFSLPAQTWAAGKTIHLVDRNELCEWLGILPPPPPEPVRQQQEQKKSVWLPRLTFKTILIGFLLLLFFLALISHGI